jgi:hypothetical protein
MMNDESQYMMMAFIITYDESHQIMTKAIIRHIIMKAIIAARSTLNLNPKP